MGGGINAYISNGGKVSIQNSSFTECNALYGGGLYARI